MPLLVTMHVFSGVPDPHWVISGDNEAELRRLIASPDAVAQAAPAHEGVLGYRGFSVVDTEADPAAKQLFQVQSAGAAAPSHSIASAPEIEHFLLWTGHGHVADEIKGHVQSFLLAPLPLPVPRPLPCPPCHAHDAPAYNPAAWNHPPVQGANNCYNYANNQITNTFAQPGRATGHMYTSLTCASVGAGAHSDGLAPCPNFTATLPAGKGWYVALVMWPGNDYHWFRQDNTGCWSHKPGGTPVKNTDNSGNTIRDPRTCNRGPYTVFCTFMITNRGVHIR